MGRALQREIYGDLYRAGRGLCSHLGNCDPEKLVLGGGVDCSDYIHCTGDDDLSAFTDVKNLYNPAGTQSPFNQMANKSIRTVDKWQKKKNKSALKHFKALKVGDKMHVRRKIIP